MTKKKKAEKYSELDKNTSDAGDESVEDKIKKSRKHLEDAEKRFQALIAKRDELHAESNLIKEERDALHKQKRETVDKIKELKEERAALVEKMREHKKRRDQAQGEAKRLIAKKRGKSDELYKDLIGQIDDLEVEIKVMDYKYQTEPLSMEKENEYLDNLKDKYKKLAKLRKLKPDHEVLLGQIEDINERITALFKLADDEHKEVDKYYNKSQKVHEQIQPLNDGISHLVEEANKKHEEFLKLNERATHFHERAMEMRSKILSIKRERREVISEARKIVDDINLEVKKRFEDDDVLDEAADDAVKKLKSKGKIEL
jgi:uncharacterized coiled-coil DUF342 family protein